MKASEFHKLRSIVACDLESFAKEPFTTVNKHGWHILEDAEWTKPDDLCQGNKLVKYKLDKKGKPFVNNMALFLSDMEENENRTIPFDDRNKYGFYSSWANVDHLAKTAEKMFPGFMNLWKWVKKTYPIRMRVTNPAVTHDFTPKDMDNFLRTDIISLLTILKHDLQGELKKWKDGLQKGDFCYCTPMSTMNSDPEIN